MLFVFTQEERANYWRMSLELAVVDDAVKTSGLVTRDNFLTAIISACLIILNTISFQTNRIATNLSNFPAKVSRTASLLFSAPISSLSLLCWNLIGVLLCESNN
jgi:hypothetical protein